MTSLGTRSLGILIIVAGLVSPSSLSADIVTLYDVGQGNLPANQGWIAVVPPPATQAHVGGRLELNTLPNQALQAGYFSESPADGSNQHPLMPVLDRHTGFSVRFDLQVLSEIHDSRDDNGDGKFDRAGFSVIAISQDLFGLELAFFEDRIWAYAAASEGTNSRFTQAEGVDFDTKSVMNHYELAMNGGQYQLYSNGTEILTGNLRNYNPSGVNPLFDPYDNPSFLFLGDDTASARSHVRLGSIEVLSVPEPSAVSMLVVLAICAGGLIGYHRLRTSC